ncbi:MAG TPA: hypothetical protein VEA69_16770 [Tepidisphaeraceae bacterium]|nr:hypothetical protein [Tepidisphaeraceae bacterium]
MAKSTPADPNAPAASVPLIKPVRPAKVTAEALAPVVAHKIERAGLGQKKNDGRRSGGNFSLKRLVIKDEVSGAVRELRVPLNMDYTDYPTIQDTEAVMEEYEEEYTSEGVRDRVLSQQVDPFYFPGRKVPGTNKDWPANLGFRPFDPAWRNDQVEQGKGAWYQGEEKTRELENRMGVERGGPVITA